MRLIDADSLEPYYRLMQDNATGMNMMALPDGVVDQQPTVDAVPVIRCRDCIYKNEYGRCTFYINFHHWTDDMDYCSDAERRDKRNG